MKNKFTISPNYLLQLENDELRERIKKLISEFKELKKLYEATRERRHGTSTKGIDAIIQE
jgi:regulator of replication initiation timing